MFTRTTTGVGAERSRSPAPDLTDPDAGAPQTWSKPPSAERERLHAKGGSVLWDRPSLWLG
jgi:hypothetical protein